MNKVLLCTDMDRTVIPNGRQPEHPDARQRFRQLCALEELCLVYVTGRHRQLVQQAIVSWQLPQPDYAVTDVGTKIYRLVRGEWREMLSWQKQIASDWRGKTHEELQQALQFCPELVLQERSRQNNFKLSYYLPLSANREHIFAAVENQLTQLGVDASLIWSIDEPEQIGLLDVLPRHATKLHVIEFLQHHLGYEHHEVIFAGDSGNDLPVLVSPIQSVLVANAEPEVRQQAQSGARKNGCTHALYLAQENFSLGGNYAAGVLQGVLFFAPQTGTQLKLS
ncbi:HAD-IIB family hydrolase [Desulforhopalus vacuolatus]|uniref:HAD-IIB family hydrolase n=1 Tax=Desulforhopalus vacuolatus TaxID=40414 RepID=UPI001963BC11|nr:HAD-IIB family hydrolase [Desulforhopalus vacuolatus]MBM9520242.1 HAD-IIB family hydrolase [Desulforhopalus vacuolatus]